MPAALVGASGTIGTIAPGASAPIPELTSTGTTDERPMLTGMEPVWPLWAWGLVLLLFVGTAVAVLVVSLFQSTPEPAFKSRDEEIASGLAVAGAVEQAPAESGGVRPTGKKSDAAATVPIPGLPLASTPSRKNVPANQTNRRSKSATVHDAKAAAAAEGKTARGGAPRQRRTSETQVPAQAEFIPPTGTQCSAAVRALALCNPQGN